ncbi:hypothetical protein [Azospirillum soli]|uniref:hypothetical protein n=1 Tax=Azospirillum soli TaxID=1304799 RepID=UPI001AE86B67|nr:hypothetical protein [Azospirillum soli]MBP2316429.1 hypothetical protein [Azospirillum soli]
MAETPQNQKPENQKLKDDSAAGTEAPMEDRSKTPGDGALQDAVPAGLSSDELRKRAEDTEGSVQPGTG